MQPYVARGPYFALDRNPYCSLAALEDAIPAASPALALYLSLVYGSAPPAELARWSWNEKDVVHFDALPPALRASACTPPLGNATYETNATMRLAKAAFYDITCPAGWSRCLANTRMLWRFDGSDHSSVCKGERGHYGGSNASVRGTELLAWAEVSHVQRYRSSTMSGADERTHLWMERARGSGLWYNYGWTITQDDFHWCTDCRFRENNLSSLIREGVETLVFQRRVGDPGQIHPGHLQRCAPGQVTTPFYKHEIVSIVPPPLCENATRHSHASHTSACPNLPAVLHRSPKHPPEGTDCLFTSWDLSRLRWGWPPPHAHASDGVCPFCTHTLVENLAWGEIKTFRIGCNWGGSPSTNSRRV